MGYVTYLNIGVIFVMLRNLNAVVYEVKVWHVADWGLSSAKEQMFSVK